MSLREQIHAIFGVAKLTFKTAPGAVLFKLFGAIITAVLPLVTTYYAAQTTTALAAAYGGDVNAKNQVLTYVIITALLGLILTVWNSFDNYIQAKMRHIVQTKVSNQMFEQFLSLDFWRYDDKDTADLYDKAQKFSQFFAWVFDRVAQVISQVIALLTAVIALAAVSRWLAGFIFIGLLPGVGVQFWLARRQVENWNNNVDTRRALNIIEWQMMQPDLISELRIYGMVKHLLQLRIHLHDKAERERISIEGKALPVGLLANTFEAAAELGALIWVSLQIIARQQPLGQFVYVQQIVSRAIGSASSLVTTISSIDEDVANLFDYQRFMQLPRSHPTGTKLSKAPQEIHLQQVSFTYPGKQSPVLDGITLTIRKHQHVAIVGENGAGKTTLVKLLTGLYRPTEGVLLLDGQDLSTVQIETWHKHLGVLGQDFIRYGFATARDNVVYGDVEAPYDHTNFEQALTHAEAASFVHKLEKGIDSYVNNWMESDDGTKGADLSGGQWQRLALARNFYRNAPIIILDEPTSAIDALAEARIFKRLFSSRDRTIITVSHRLSTIKKADTIYVLKEGKLVESGTHDELLAKQGHFFTMFESQING